MKRCSTSLAIRKIQIKTITMYIFFLFFFLSPLAIGVRFYPSGFFFFFFLLCYCSAIVFFSLSLSCFLFPHPMACGILVHGLAIRPEPLRQERWVQTAGTTENIRFQGILIGVRYPRGPHLNTKIWFYSTACKPHCWKPQVK